MQSQLGELFYLFCLRCGVYRHRDDYKVMVYDMEGESWLEMIVKYLSISKKAIAFWFIEKPSKVF